MTPHPCSRSRVKQLQAEQWPVSPPEVFPRPPAVPGPRLAGNLVRLVLAGQLLAARVAVPATVQYSTVQYSTALSMPYLAQYSKAKYSTVQYSTVQYRTVQYSIVQYSTAPTIPHLSQYRTVQ